MRYQSTRPKRQFLAGVKCPDCQSLDTVVQVQIFEPEMDEYIECTQCGYQERRPDPDEVAALNNERDAASTTGTSGTVKFIP